MSIIKI